MPQSRWIAGKSTSYMHSADSHEVHSRWQQCNTDTLTALKSTGAPAVILRRPAWSDSKCKPRVPDSKAALNSLHPVVPSPLALLWSLSDDVMFCISLAPHLVTDLSNTSHCTNYHIMRWHILLVSLNWLKLILHVTYRDIMGPQSCEDYRWRHWVICLSPRCH